MKLGILASQYVGKTWLLRGIPDGDNRTLSQRLADACSRPHAPNTTNTRCPGCGLYFGADQ
jgi:hypothetical protein